MIVEFTNAVVVNDDKPGQIVLELQGAKMIDLSDLHNAVSNVDLLPVSKAQLHESIENIVFTECLHSHIVKQAYSPSE